MTTQRLTVLSCDGECGATIPGLNKDEVRKDGAADRWQLDGDGNDFCPKCRKVFGDLSSSVSNPNQE